MKWIRAIGTGLLLLVGLFVGVLFYFEEIANPRVTRELHAAPDGDRARRVMLLTLPSGREIPVNYLREDDTVYAAADGRWWRELAGEGGRVEVWIRGEVFSGQGQAVEDDPARVKQVFDRLRPDAIEGFGTLIEITLGERFVDPGAGPHVPESP